jgi:hypothetical protein
MDEVEVKLMNVARELAAVSQSRLQVTATEIAELEEQLRQLKAQRYGQLDAQGRLDSYHPKTGAEEYRCPNCWIRDGQSTLLKSIPFERPEQDVMRCPSCGRDFGISLRAQAHV